MNGRGLEEWGQAGTSRKTATGSHLDDMRRAYRLAMRYPRLTKEEESDLIRDYQETGNLKAADKLVRSFTHLVISTIAKPWKYSGYALPFDDVFAEGNMALLQSIKNFEPSHGRLSTYARINIKYRTMEYLRKHSSTISYSSSSGTRDRKVYFAVLRARKMAHALGHQATLTSCLEAEAVKAGVDMRSMEMMLTAIDRYKMVNLNHSPRSDTERGDCSDLVVYTPHVDTEFHMTQEETPEDTLINEDLQAKRLSMVRNCLHVLDERERLVVLERFFKDKAVTLSELKGRLGVSTEGVRLIQNRAIAKIRKAIVEKTHETGFEY